MTKFKLLTDKQKKLFLIGFVSGLIMLINSIYLILASHVAGIGNDPEVLPVTYQVMLVTHVSIGCVLLLFAIFFVFFHFPRMYKLKRKWTRLSGVSLISTLLFLLITGFFILSEANSRDNAWVFISHQVAAALLIIAYLAHRLLSRDPPKQQQFQYQASMLLAALAVIWIFHFIETGHFSMTANASESGQYELKSLGEEKPNKELQANDYEFLFPFNALGDPDANSPFFPSKTTTSTGGWLPARILTHDDIPELDDFMKETREKGFAPSHFLGAQSCQRCHADIVEQWATSAHRFSSFNNLFYRRSVELTREKIGKKASQFCGSCHDPAVMLAGNMIKEIDPLTPESQAGLTCLSCHAIDSIHDRTGNGNYNIHDKTESPYIFDFAKSGMQRVVHDYVLKAKPTVHKQRMLKPIFQQSEFCLTCHKVNLDVAVNDYRWLRGQNEYDAWHNSGFAHNQPRTWYEPPEVKTCQDCHMPKEEAILGDVAAKNGSVKSHRFLSVNTALPYLRNDMDTIRRMEEFLQDGKLKLDIFALHREDGRLVMGLENKMVELKPGELIQLDLVIRNLQVGHTFPGGTNDSNQGWIDLKVELGGKEVFRSGAVDENRYVDPSSHFYQAVLVDKDGNRINKRNASDIYTAVYANVIAPSTSDIARYRFRLPENIKAGTLKVTAKLLWRKFNREYTEFVFEGMQVPDLPITTIETDQIELLVKEKGHKNIAANMNSEQWLRFNDYGIGTFLDNDTQTAIKAFTMVTQLQPEKMDGWFNLGKTYLQQGSLSKADDMLRKASEIAPNQPRIAFFWGRLLEKSGRLKEAVKAYERTLQSYPQSRDTWARLGRTYWLAGDMKDSIDAYTQVLKIDPENAQAFHQLSLAYKSLAASEANEEKKRGLLYKASEMEKGFEKYKVDEDATKVARKYRSLHPHDNKMSQRIVIHGEG